MATAATQAAQAAMARAQAAANAGDWAGARAAMNEATQAANSVTLNTREAQATFNAVVTHQQQIGAMFPATPTGGGGGGGGGGGAATPTGPTTDQQNAITAIQGRFAQMGLGSLGDLITYYITKGYSEDAISVLIRDSPEYKARFPAMAALTARGRGISEAAYISYESNAATLERQYGLPTGMLTGAVTSLLTNEVSANELNNRVQLGAAAAYTAPEQTRTKFKEYFGVGSQAALIAHYIDPAVAQPYLEKQYAQAIIGGAGLQQGVDVGLDIAAGLADAGVSDAQARQGFGQVASATSLQSGKGETASQGDLVGAAFGTSAEATEKVARVAGSRKAGFNAGGGFAGTNAGTTGIGSSSI